MFKPKKGAIAAGDELTAQAGYEILKSGGNAFDGAIAATLMSFVASSTITSMGGGGFMISCHHGKNISLLDFFTETPLQKRSANVIDFFPVMVDFGDKSQKFHVGKGTMATPGNLAGLFHIHKKYGTIPFIELATPAMEAAKKGVVLHKQTKYQADILEPILSLSDIGRQIYTNNDKIRGLGQSYKLPFFSDFLEYISKEGPREFYEGEISEKISKDSYDHGGHLTRDDFLNYKVIERKPLDFKYRDYQVLTNPPPNSGGPLINFTLSLLDQFRLDKAKWGSADHLSLLSHAIEYTSMARQNIFIENRYSKEVMKMLFEENFYQSILQSLKKENRKSGNTTHVSIADEDDNFVSITTSVGEGCGYYIPGTHIMMNNMLGEEDLNPEGFHEWQPRKRLSSMMSPTLLLKNKQPIAALGSGGSNRIRSALVQAISNFVDFEMPPDESVNSPRIHWEDNHLDVEPGFDMDIIERLHLPQGARKILWSEKNMYFGGVHGIFKDKSNNLIPAGDRRRVGAIRKSN